MRDFSLYRLRLHHFGYIFFEPEYYFLFQSRYIRLRDAENVRNFLLRFFGRTAETEPHLHDDALAARQAIERLAQQLMLGLRFKFLADGIGLGAEYIRHYKFVALSVHVERLVKRNFGAQTNYSAQVHQYLVFDTARRISRELDVFVGIERIYRFNQSYSAYRDQVLYVYARIVELARNINYKPEIMFYKRGFDLGIGL